MTFDIDIGFTSAAGNKPINEDFCGALLPEPGAEERGAIVAVADGVSRGGMGKEAAQTTVISVLRDYFGTPKNWDTTVALDRIIAAQNAWLAAQNERRHPALGMTTLTALVLRGHSYALAHVGDTRAYLLRQKQLQQLTQDHVMHHPDFQHQLLRAVGRENRVAVDYQQGELQVGDVFVLMSDGVHGAISSKRLEALLHEALQPDSGLSSAQAASEKIVAAALKAGSQDNATALIVRVQGLLDAGLQDAQQLADSLPMPPRFKVGSQIDGFVVTAQVADNGINLLYQVRAENGQLYVLKTLHPARAHDADERAMLAHEAWLARRLKGDSSAHQNLVQVHHSLPNHQSRSAFYVLYDWHTGVTLQQILDTQSQPNLAQALQAAQHGLLALGRLHRQGVIHRDIKPANLHWGDDGVLRLLDLGVALSGHEPEAMRKLHAGTPSYINPEQWGFNGKNKISSAHPVEEAADAQSDLFALGVTLYQLLTHKLPYGDILPYQVGRYYRDPTPPTRHNPKIPMWLHHVLMKAVARDKAQRFETAEEFLLALERGAARPLPASSATPLLQRHPASPWKIGLAVSLLFNFVLIFWLLFLPK